MFLVLMLKVVLCVASALCQTATVCEDFFVGLFLPKEKVMFIVCHEQLYLIFFLYPFILYSLELRSIALIVLCCLNFQCLALSVWKLSFFHYYRKQHGFSVFFFPLIKYCLKFLLHIRIETVYLKNLI